MVLNLNIISYRPVIGLAGSFDFLVISVESDNNGEKSLTGYQ
jgi:hypothetical protein